MLLTFDWLTARVGEMTKRDSKLVCVGEREEKIEAGEVRRGKYRYEARR